MKTIEIQLFKFAELSSEAQQNAIQKERECMYETGEVLYNFYEYCVEKLTECGFVNPKIEYSLSYSQGDGLSFWADSYTILNDIILRTVGVHHPKITAFLSNNLAIKIKGNKGRYCFASESDIEMELSFYPNNVCPQVISLLDKILENIQSVYMATCKALENDGYAEIEYLQSDKAIIETLEANDYDFTANGKIY